MKLTPMYNKHLELGATMYTTGTGYAMPAFYRPAAEEARAVREHVGMIDLSLMSRLDLKGPAAAALVQKLIVNDAGRLKDGQALYSTMCNDHGLIMDDVVVMRFDPQHFRIVTSSMFRYKTHDWIRAHMAGLDVSLTDVSSGLAMIGVQGPKSRELLRGITDIDLEKLGFFRFTRGRIGDLPCMIARLGFWASSVTSVTSTQRTASLRGTPSRTPGNRMASRPMAWMRWTCCAWKRASSFSATMPRTRTTLTSAASGHLSATTAAISSAERHCSPSSSAGRQRNCSAWKSAVRRQPRLASRSCQARQPLAK